MPPLPASGSPVTTQTAIPNARAFVRSLNVLLKFARLYGLEHARSAGQFEVCWSELREAVGSGGPTGLLLGASGSQLLLDGVPLESTPAERSFADLLDTAGVASICFQPNVDRDELANLVRAFMETGPRAGALTDRLERYLGKASACGIRVNEIRFVAEDAGFSEARVAAQLTAKTLGADAERIQDWFRSPEKMIQLIAAAEGSHGSGTASGGGQGGAGVPHGTGTGPGLGGGAGSGQGGGSVAAGSGFAGLPQLEEAELQSLLRLLAQFGEAAHGKNPQQLEQVKWQQKLATLPQNAQLTLRQALARMAAQNPSAKMDEATLLRLAEDLAIRFALDRFQRGEVRVNAVRQMLEKMGHELGTLRKLLRAREEKMANAGLSVESHADVLDRQFWATVPESGKRAVLMSTEAWCIPPRNVQQYVEELLKRGESDVAGDVLVKYATCVRSRDAEARKKAAIGLGQLAELYSKAASQRLQEAITQIGQQMAAEKDPELQTLLSAAFVRLSQESSSRRYYRAMQQALDALSDLEELRPTWVQSLRPRIGVENRVPEFIEEALTAEAMPDGLVGVLMRVPQVAGEHLAVRLARSGKRSERENVVQLAKAIGAACPRHLKEVFKSEQRGFHDAIVRQLSVAGAPDRGALLTNSLELLDSMALPLALDEIGMCGDPKTADKLLQLAEGAILPEASDYLRVKAIEALGRMRAISAAGTLHRFVEARKAFGWAYPEEIRTAAIQALAKIDPEWTRGFVPQSGLDGKVLALAPLDPIAERDVVRHRRYKRIRLPRNVPAVITSQRGKYSSSISVLSLEGGLLNGDVQLAVGTEATLKIPAGLRSISMRAVVRFVRSHQAGFEMIGMGIDDRAKLRRLLVSLADASGTGDWESQQAV
jgi:PilZ domain